MPFACAAVIGLALMWLTYLTVIQLFSGPRKDIKSELPVPPRKVQGHGAWPVLGHTLLFLKTGGDMAVKFPSEWKEWKWNPWSREIGDCFSVFIWGQWRVVVKGQERAQKVIEEADLDQGWAWSPPITLLGQNCLALLHDEQEAGCLRQMIEGPLNQEWVIKQAPAFAEMARKCIADIVDGQFSESNKTLNDSGHGQACAGKANTKGEDPIMLHRCDSGSSDSFDSDTKALHKIKWDALRSYTFDLMDGPILHLDSSGRSSSSSYRATDGQDEETGRTVRFQAGTDTASNNKQKTNRGKKITRDLMLLWMERLKYGLCDIKLTFGKEWMQLWRLNWYGRAVIARDHLEEILGAHVEARDKLVPVHHEQGHSIRDPFANFIPLIAITQDAFRPKESVMGRRGRSNSESGRQRTFSEPELPHPDSNVSSGSVSRGSPQRARAVSEPNYVIDQLRQKLQENPSSTKPKRKKKKPSSILDHMLRQEDNEGMGITRAATTEIILLLWMMMDAGQAWTAMALNLLSMDEDACRAVQSEVDRLEKQYGRDRLFTSFVLEKMEKIDALIYEAVRLCPEFLGGMKVVKETVEVGGLQIPKNSNVIFCNPTEEKFDLNAAVGKRPEAMGMNYPSTELHGFLALQGLEVPLMVLQTKVFLIVLLQNYSPFLSKRRTFIRRVQTAIHKSFTRRVDSINKANKPCESIELDLECGEGGSSMPPSPKRSNSTGDEGLLRDLEEQESLAMKLFTSIPFPEPRRVINIRPRGDKFFPAVSPGLPNQF